MVKHLDLTGVYFASPLSGICALYMYIYIYMRVHIATNTKLCAFSVEYWNLSENLTTLLPFLPWSLDMSRLDWRLLGCVGLFLWPIPGNLVKMHAQANQPQLAGLSHLTQRKTGFSQQDEPPEGDSEIWECNRGGEAMENFCQVFLICIPNKIQLASTEKQKTWGWDEISLACLVYNLKNDNQNQTWGK